MGLQYSLPKTVLGNWKIEIFLSLGGYYKKAKP
jgi:hypothetical protein